MSHGDYPVDLWSPRNDSHIPIEIIQFPSGEYLTKINDAIPKDKKILIVSSIVPPTNDSLMKLISIIDAAQNGGAEDITLVAPYLGYSRQNSMEKPYSSIGVKIIAKILESIGVTRLVTVDIHSLESLDFFSIPVIHISLIDIVSHYSESLNLDNYTIIAPDKGSSKRLHGLDSQIVTMSKTRRDGNIYMELNGDVEGKNCMIIDDIFDSGNTMKAAAECLKHNKALEVVGYSTHFIGHNAPAIPLYITDTVPLILDKLFFRNIFPITPVICKFL